MPHRKAYTCWETERQKQRLGPPEQADLRRNTNNRRVWTRYLRCLFWARACQRGIQESMVLERHSSRYPRAERTRQKALKRAYEECPLPALLTQVRPILTRYTQSVGPYNTKGAMWCRRMLSYSLRRKYRKVASMSRHYQRRWKKLMWGLARCYYQRAVRFQGGSIARSTCRAMRQKLNRAKTILRQPGLSEQELRRDFPACF